MGVASYVVHENEAFLKLPDASDDGVRPASLGGSLPLVFQAARPGSILMFLDATHRLWPSLCVTAAKAVPLTSSPESPDGFDMFLPQYRLTTHDHALIFIRRPWNSSADTLQM